MTDCATATKVLLSILILTSVAINIPLSAYRSWFSPSYATIFEELRVSRGMFLPHFYRATACNATHGIAVAILSVCPSVCLSVRPSVRCVYCDKTKQRTANIYQNYQNYCKFDEVLTKTNLLSFFGTRCTLLHQFELWRSLI